MVAHGGSTVVNVNVAVNLQLLDEVEQNNHDLIFSWEQIIYLPKLKAEAKN